MRRRSTKATRSVDGPQTTPPRSPEDYVSREEDDAWKARAYFQGGRQVASSREVRADYPELELGTWRIDDWVGAYGREISELVELCPRDLTPTEFDWRHPKDQLQYQGKWRDALRYASWMDDGWMPPPITVVESQAGDLRVVDGHRRLAAADMAGVPIRAWVSWAADHPRGLTDAQTGEPLIVGLTYEISHPRAANAAREESRRYPRMFRRQPNPAPPPVMLAHPKPEDFDPKGWYASEKLDGVRAYWDGKRMISRAGNVFAAPKWFTEGWPDVPMDGEIFGGRGQFHETSGLVRRLVPHPGWKKLVYFVFDLPTHPGTWQERQQALEQLVEQIHSPYLAAVPSIRVRSRKHLDQILDTIEKAGGEGVMIVDPKSRYVGARTRGLLKVKSFKDAEGVVVRHQPGKGRHKGRLGALWVRDDEGREFKVGTGFTDEERRRAKELYPPGTVITYSFFERTPSGKPRFPAFMRVRAEEPTARAGNMWR